MALTDSNEVYAWGRNYHGQLGLGNNTHYNSPQKLNLRHIKKISCGVLHTMALDNSGEVYAWGRNNYRQLGLDNNINQNFPQKLNLRHIKKIGCGYHYTIVLTNHNEVYIWGSHFDGPMRGVYQQKLEF